MGGRDERALEAGGRRRCGVSVGARAGAVGVRVGGVSLAVAERDVVFKNQDRAQPATRSALGARRHTLTGIQRPVLQQLASGNARDVHSYTTLNAVSATVSPSQLSALRSDPAVAEVVPNSVVRLAPRS